ncbi:MAG: hypothetical protein ACLFPU_10255 [Dehalococcoidia bacterium]
MFWNKKTAKEGSTETKVEKLSGPRAIPAIVGSHLVDQFKQDADLIPLLKAVVRKRSNGDKGFDIRIFDEADATVKQVTVRNYTTLDQNPSLIICEGLFDEQTKHVELTEKKTINYNVPILTEQEIREKIEALSNPGDFVFFYQARGPASGGPLGRGASVIELNPGYPGKRQKKYIIYTADVDGVEPKGKGQKLYDADKPKDIAKWVKEAHHKRAF